jgi:hypothetical protein
MRHAGGRAALKAAELPAGDGACGYARDLGAGSCDDRRIRQVIGRNAPPAPRHPALCSL